MTQLWARCEPCDEWFIVPDPSLDAYLLCPVCLTVAARWEERADSVANGTDAGA